MKWWLAITLPLLGVAVVFASGYHVGRFNGRHDAFMECVNDRRVRAAEHWMSSEYWRCNQRNERCNPEDLARRAFVYANALMVESSTGPGPIPGFGN